MTNKPWPTDRVQIVCSRPEHFNYATLQGFRVEGVCADCGCDISMDSHTLCFAEQTYKFANQPRTICVACLQTYKRSDVTHLHDLRRAEK